MTKTFQAALAQDTEGAGAQRKGPGCQVTEGACVSDPKKRETSGPAAADRGDRDPASVSTGHFPKLGR